MKKTVSRHVIFCGILMLSALFAMSAATKEVGAQVTSNDPRWRAADDQKQEAVTTESGTATTPQRWYERPSGAQQQPVDQPALQQGTPAAERPWYQQESPAATGAPPAARQPHVNVPVERKEEAIGGGRPGGVLPEMPQRGMPGRDMGPAGTAKQPPGFSPFDRGVGPGAVSSGRTKTDRGWVAEPIRSFNDDGWIVEIFDSEDAQWPREMEYWADDEENFYYHQEFYDLAPIPQDEEGDDTDSEKTTESRSGDPDDWYGGEAPPSRTGVGGTLQDRRPARDGRVGGESDDERESVHAPRPELDIDDQVGERAGQVGDRRERGPGFQIRLPEDRLGDPPGAGGTR